MSSCQHSARWHTVDPNLGGPMARRQRRNGFEDFFVFEPSIIEAFDAIGQKQLIPVIPTRWFLKKSDGLLYAQVRQLYRTAQGNLDGYNVSTLEDTVQLQRFHLSYPRFLELHASLGLPSPQRIFGRLCILSTFVLTDIPFLSRRNSTYRGWEHYRPSLGTSLRESMAGASKE